MFVEWLDIWKQNIQKTVARKLKMVSLVCFAELVFVLNQRKTIKTIIDNNCSIFIIEGIDAIIGLDPAGPIFETNSLSKIQNINIINPTV